MVMSKYTKIEDQRSNLSISCIISLLLPSEGGQLGRLEEEGAVLFLRSEAETEAGKGIKLNENYLEWG